MNNKGNIFFSVTIGLFIFIIGVLFIPFFTDDITTARTDLECSNVNNITNGVMATCLLIDLVVPYLIWFFVSMALGFAFGD